MAAAKKTGAHWRDLPSEERIKDPAFLAHIAASRAACGLPPRIEDPVVLAQLAGLMKEKPAETPAAPSEERAA